jgi:hypothetical protein
MWFIEAYILFATTTALAGLYELVYPVISSVRKTHPELTIIKHSWVTYLVSFVIMYMAAPVFLPVVLVPSMGETFRSSLRKSFTQDQE